MMGMLLNLVNMLTQNKPLRAWFVTLDLIDISELNRKTRFLMGKMKTC